jgi:hypothetical protein
MLNTIIQAFQGPPGQICVDVNPRTVINSPLFRISGRETLYSEILSNELDFRTDGPEFWIDNGDGGVQAEMAGTTLSLFLH